MNDSRKPLFVTPSIFPGTPTLTLYHDTWHDHILKGHVAMIGQEANVQLIASAPTVVTAGTSNSNNLIFINQSVTSASGSPLVVIVDPAEKVICSAYHNRSFKIIAQDKVLWLP